MLVVHLLVCRRPGVASCRMFSLAESSMQLSRLAPLNLLVMGWGEADFMAQLLAALGTGEWGPGGSRTTDKCTLVWSRSVIHLAGDPASVVADRATLVVCSYIVWPRSTSCSCYHLRHTLYLSRDRPPGLIKYNFEIGHLV
jgi:hypothetical protein